MLQGLRYCLALLVLVLLSFLNRSAAAQSQDEQPPDVPPLEEVQEGADYVYDPELDAYIPRPQPPETPFVPMDFRFRIGIVGEYAKEIMTPAGPQEQIKNPLILINPRDGDIGVYAKNFPARIVANSPNGSWIIGVAESSSVEGSSGSRQRECAVSLNMTDNEVSIIEEFPIFSKFQAFFSPRDHNSILYCVNEPATVNVIVNYNLRSEQETPLEIEGNRFYLHGVKSSEPRGIWLTDPFSLQDYPVLELIALNDGHTIETVSFPGCNQVLSSPDGDTLLAVVQNGAEASLGYYSFSDKSFNQVPGLVLTRPTLKWAHHGLVVLAKESTATRDRFLQIDLPSGNVREIWSDYSKILYWDISPEDDALVFVADSEQVPLVYIVPLDPTMDTVNCIHLQDVSDISWVGCLNPPSGGGSWLDRLLPF
jgi:hypothetical protein